MTNDPRIAGLVGSRYLIAAAATLVAVLSVGFGRAALVAQERQDLARLADVAESAARLSEHAAFTGAIAQSSAKRMEMVEQGSLALALSSAGIPWADVERAMGAVADVFDADRLRRGQEVAYTLENVGGEARLTGLAFHSDPGRAVTVARLADGSFWARELETPTQEEVAHIAGSVQGSFYASAVGAGATDREVAEVADVFAYDLDFQRDVRPGDQFEMVFEREFDELGRTVETGALMFVSLKTRKGAKSFYRFRAPGDSKAEWYDSAGKAARKFLMRTPINGARLSSSFGMRRHPILGYSKLHRGTDFAAPTGTPVFAAGDAIVSRAGWYGGYGNYIALKHDDKYATAYGHLSRIARGVRPGSRVRQGQVIGYVGTTGRSTGPHLHYEVLYRGAQINPMSLRVPTGRNLEGRALVAFDLERERIDALRARKSAPAVVAASFQSGAAASR